MKIEISFLLPLAAFVAIGLFITREILDSIRKHQEKSRKMSAAKSMLAFETERNFYTQKRIFYVVRDIKESYDLGIESEYSAIISSAGDVNYSRIEKGEKHGFGMPIPKIHTNEFDRWLPIVAEFDKTMFDEIMKMQTTIFELEHLRSSLLRFLLNEETEGQFWLEGFTQYALCHTTEMDDSFREFYMLCANTKEIPIRMR